ncbi:MAG: hypothetical protein HQ513_11725 [Rhodospirillales bacterium]|nr:hypothetical protein [Rhodospirillales bacterium]
MTDVTLSAAVRSTLLSLQNTSSLIDRTQNRLSTGLRVASAQDDPISFFQAKTLDDRSLVFTEKKDGIDQGISSLSTALEGVTGIENIVRQLKGLATSLKSSTGTQFTDLITQFNALRTQIGTLADDTTFQGINLVNSTSESLSVSFSDKTASLLTVQAVNVRQSGLSIGSLGAAAATAFTYSADASFNFSDVIQAGATNFSFSADTAFKVALTSNTTIALTYEGSAQVINTASNVIVNYGTIAIGISLTETALTGVALVSGTVINVSVVSQDNTNQIGIATTVTTAFVGILQNNVTTLGTAGTDVDVVAENRLFIATGAANSTLGGQLTLTYQGSAQTITTGSIDVTYGTVTVTLGVGTSDAAGSGLALSAGQIITVTLNSVNATGFIGAIAATAASGVDVAVAPTTFVTEGNSAQIDVSIAQLDAALTTLRSSAQTLGSNVALLQTRLDFTDLYVDELDGGSAKLVLADINEEGANLLALQTRQQLGISALAFAGQAEQGILALFR